jgi:hypothetical protein
MAGIVDADALVAPVSATAFASTGRLGIARSIVKNSRRSASNPA